MSLDTMSTAEVLSLMNREDKAAVAAVEAEIPHIAKAVDLVVASFTAGGRLIYIGAGTSGRLGVIDAAECPPTFGVPRTQVQGIIAGGARAMRRSVEGAEDSRADGEAAIRGKRVGPKDTVLGITASSMAPYVVAGMETAKALGAKTVFFCCSPVKKPRWADVLINPLVGAEILSGSTRLKAGTATKLTLNMITTASMVRMGKVYENLMVDLKPWCYKLELRARRIIRTLTGAKDARAEGLLLASGNDLKVALVMQLRNVPRREAYRLLVEAGGNLRSVIEGKSVSDSGGSRITSRLGVICATGGLSASAEGHGASSPPTSGGRELDKRGSAPLTPISSAKPSVKK
jgi:N-acetylmuramic acid 6-phosphate etherase